MFVLLLFFVFLVCFCCVVWFVFCGGFFGGFLCVFVDCGVLFIVVWASFFYLGGGGILLFFLLLLFCCCCGFVPRDVSYTSS